MKNIFVEVHFDGFDQLQTNQNHEKKGEYRQHLLYVQEKSWRFHELLKQDDGEFDC